MNIADWIGIGVGAIVWALIIAAVAWIASLARGNNVRKD